MKIVLGLFLQLGACGGVAPAPSEPPEPPASASQASCTPTCDQYSCGLPNGCGGTCGCPTGQICYAGNTCGPRCPTGTHFCDPGCYRICP